MKKHICMIAYTNYLTDARVRREAETLAALPSYKIIVLALKENASPKTHHIEGVEVRQLDITKYQGRSKTKYLLSYLKFLLLAFFACNKLLLYNSLDIVHVHNMPNFLVFSAIIPYLFGKKIILDIHDTMVEIYLAKFEGTPNRLYTRALFLEESICCALAHRIICVNHLQRAALVKRGIPERKIVISMNVPDPKIFDHQNIVVNRTVVKKNFKLLYHGTVTKRLSVDLAIRAVASLINRIPGLEFYILGDGDDTQEFIDLSRDLGIQEVIHFRKRIPFEDMVQILVGMDLEVVPNRKNVATELMLPVKVLDCVALGIPVVVPRLKAIEYYFTDAMLFYFEPDNIGSFADTILYAYNNETERITKTENAKLFLKKYGWETHKFSLINLYRSFS